MTFWSTVPVHHSIDLDMTYRPVWPGQPLSGGRSARVLTLVFEDGTEYTWEEALEISHVGGSREDIRALHAIKRHLDGQILPTPILAPDLPASRPPVSASYMTANFPGWPYRAKIDENGRFLAPGSRYGEQLTLFEGAAACRNRVNPPGKARPGGRRRRLLF